MSNFGVIGGVCTAHAPQLWTLPDSEDVELVGRLKFMLGEVGDRLLEMKPDICVVIGNDHANQFLLHCTTSFTMHIGKVAKGAFAGRDYSYTVASDAGLALLRHVQRNGFDPGFTSNAEIDYAFAIPLDFTGIKSVPVVPVFVNAYIPPQPSMERCFIFGRALGDGIKALGLRAVVVCSGGLSHFPGTARYSDPGPDTEFDRHFMNMMENGGLRYLLALDERSLDRTGNIELRCWGVAAGMIGDRAPNLTNFEPTWHHNYGTVAWTVEPEAENFTPHYPSIHPELVKLSETLHRLANNADERMRYLADPKAYAESVADLTQTQRDTLVSLDQERMIEIGMHPFIPHTYRRVLERAGILTAETPTKSDQ
ncbi:MAG: hypothetical protein VYA17_02175 [Pseudomonadota bacterium]|nr:hypothetical protein [Pseudomonadota bacterium]